MADNRVSIIITARDMASDALRRLGESLGNAGEESRRFQRNISDINGDAVHLTCRMKQVGAGGKRNQCHAEHHFLSQYHQVQLYIGRNISKSSNRKRH